MSVFGKLDAKAMGTDVAVTNGDATVTTAGDFTDSADNLVEVGDVLDLSGVAYIVKTVTSATSIELHTTYAGSTGTVAAASALRRTPPRAVAEFVIKGGDTNSYELLFVDDTEKDIASNKSRGITGPGWWQYRTHVDSNGNTRHKAECLAFVHATAVAAGDDSDDTLVADALEVLSISAQPGDATTSSGGATFAVTAAASLSGTIAYVWQRRTSSTGRWTNVSGTLDGSIYTNFTTATLTVTGATADEDGYQYRVKLTTSKGAEELISDTATLTFGT